MRAPALRRSYSGVTDAIDAIAEGQQMAQDGKLTRENVPRRQVPMLAAALAVTAAGLAAGMLTASPARATPPAGVTTKILGSGTTLGGFAICAGGIKVESKDAASFTVAHLTFAPGGTTGWHACPGPVLVIVTTGSVTKYSAQDCTAQTYTAGQAFVENGPTDETMVRNDGSVPAETIVTFLKMFPIYPEGVIA